MNSAARGLVLVHGGWMGGWAWHAVTPNLTSEGYEVHTPTLLGLGDRWSSASAAVDISMQTADLIEQLEMLDAPFTLLGHSYAGMVVTLLADRRPDLVERLVILDGFVPRDGEGMPDLVDPGEAAATKQEVDATGFRAPPVARWPIADPTVERFVSERLTPQPGGTSRERLHLSGAFAGRCDYISAMVGQRPHFARIAERIALDTQWSLHEYNGGHLDMLTSPDQLSFFLLDVLAA